MRIGRRPSPKPPSRAMSDRLRAFERDLIGWTVETRGDPADDLRELLLAAALRIDRMQDSLTALERASS